MLKFIPRTFRAGLLIGIVIAAAVAAGAIAYERYDTQTLKRTVRRDAVLCGVNADLPGFSTMDNKGQWQGFDVDYCRAIAAAIFNDPNKVKYVALDANERFNELSKRRSRCLAAQLNLEHVARNRLCPALRGRFVLRRPGFHGPQLTQHLRPRWNSTTARCASRPTPTSVPNLADYFRVNNMKYQEVRNTKAEDVRNAYNSGQCNVWTADVSRLYAERLKLSKPDDHIILADVISKEPLAPVVRQKDDDWLLIVKWTVYAMVVAEELGINSKNIDEAMKSEKPEIKRFVGTEGAYGEQLGLSKDWAAPIIRHVGNYSEVYDRNVGVGSPLGIPRGLNQLWSEGGIQYAPPIR